MTLESEETGDLEKRINKHTLNYWNSNQAHFHFHNWTLSWTLGCDNEIKEPKDTTGKSTPPPHPTIPSTLGEVITLNLQSSMGFTTDKALYNLPANGWQDHPFCRFKRVSLGWLPIKIATDGTNYHSRDTIKWPSSPQNSKIIPPTTLESVRKHSSMSMFNGQMAKLHRKPLMNQYLFPYTILISK